MATQIIKLNNGQTGTNAVTYVPVTTTEAIQHSWGTSNKQQLKSYLGELKSAISTVASAELETRNNLAATYIKPGTNANQISYNLPNGTYGLITINNVENATNATNLTAAPTLNDSTATLTVGGQESASMKAGNTTYGFTIVETTPRSGSTNAISSGYAHTLPTKEFVEEAVSGAFANVAAALKYKGTVNSNSDLQRSHEVGDVWVVATAGNYIGKACEVGDYIICNTAGNTANNAHWDVLNGENQVSQTNSSFTVGAASKELANVDGTSINLQIVQEANVAHMSDFASYVKTISSSSSNGVITSAVKTGQDIKFTYTDVSSSGTATTETTLSTTAKTITPGWTQNSHGKVTSVTGVSIKQDHEGTGGANSVGKLTYWNSETTHTAVTSSYGNSSTKYVYVDGGVLKEGTLPEGNKVGKNIVGNSATATANANASDGNVHLNHIENNSVQSHHKITGSNGITVTATDTGSTISIDHSTSAGYKHIPSGGSANQVLKYGSSSGTAEWGSLTEGLKYEIYNSTDDFTLDLGESTGSVSLAKTTF